MDNKSVKWRRSRMFNQYQNPMSYNPAQARIESLMQQRQMIDNQLNALNQMPNININQFTTPQGQGQGMAQSFDFNGKWVANQKEAMEVANNNMPLIFLDKEKPYLYTKDQNGNFKTFELKEVSNDVSRETNSEIENKVNSLEQKMDAILNAIGANSAQVAKSEVNVQQDTKASVKQSKQSDTSALTDIQNSNPFKTRKGQ